MNTTRKITPEEIRKNLKSAIDELMREESFSLLITVNRKDGLVLTSSSIGLKPDYVELGKCLYSLIEENPAYGERFTQILRGMDEMLAGEEADAKPKPAMKMFPSKTLS